MKPGEEKTITVTFPEDYPTENLKGKPADFKLKLHEVKKRVLPELNDEFVKELNIENITTVEAYLNHVRDNPVSYTHLSETTISTRPNQSSRTVGC